MTTIFLDYDGVLHSAESHLNDQGEPYLKSAALPVEYEAKQLFEYAPLLDSLLVDYQDVQIVLTTSWVEVFGFEYARACLPAGLQARVVASIYSSALAGKNRPQRIQSYVERYNVGQWLAIDDDPYGWHDADRDHLLLCNVLAGLAGAGALEALRDKLERLQC